MMRTKLKLKYVKLRSIDIVRKKLLKYNVGLVVTILIFLFFKFFSSPYSHFSKTIIEINIDKTFYR